MRLFIDTSCFAALEDVDDANHLRAIEFREMIRKGKTSFKMLYTSNYVIDETLTLLRMKCAYATAVRFREVLEASKVVNVLWIDRTMEDKAWQIFRQYQDKEFSFTDCASFAVMERESIRTAWAFDKHFTEYGFDMVP